MFIETAVWPSVFFFLKRTGMFSGGIDEIAYFDMPVVQQSERQGAIWPFSPGF